MTSTTPLPSPAPSRLPLFLALALILAFDLVLLGPYAVVHFHDSFDVEFLNWVARGRILREWGLTAWYPDFCGGMPAFAGHHPPYALPVLAAAYLPLWAVYALGRVLCLAMAGQGMHRLLGGHFRAGEPVASAGAALFVLGLTSFGVYLPFSFAFPLVFLWFLDLADGRGSLFSRMAKVLAFALLSWWAYPVLTAPYVPALHLAMVLAFGREKGRTGRRVLAVVLAWTGYALLFAPLLFALTDYLPFIQRGYAYRFDGWLPALASTLKDAAATLREDQPALALFLFGLPGLFSRDRAWAVRLRLALALVLAPALIAALSHSPFMALAAGTLLAKADLGNVLRLLQFTLPLFAVLALAARRAAPASRREWIEAGLAVGACGLLAPAYEVMLHALALGAGLAALGLARQDMAWQGAHPSVPGTGKPAPVARPDRRRTLALAGLGLALAGAVLFNRQILLIKHSHVPYHRGYGGHPELAELAARERGRPARVLCVDLHPSVAQQAGFEVVEGKGVLFNKYFKQVFKGLVRPQLADPKAERAFDGQWYQLFSTRVDIHRNYYLEFNPGAPRRASEFNLDLARLMNVKYVLAARPVEGLEAASLSVLQSNGTGLPAGVLKGTAVDRFERLPLWVYRLRDPLERGFLARPRVLASREAVLAALERAGRPELASRALLAAEDVPAGLFPAPEPEQEPGSGGADPGQVRCTAYAPDRLSFAGQARGPALLVVTNNFDPRWSARVNGKPAPVLRADHAFQAVPVPDGPFTVELAYAFPLVWDLHGVSLAGLLLILATALFPGGGPVGQDTRPEARPDAHPEENVRKDTNRSSIRSMPGTRGTPGLGAPASKASGQAAPGSPAPPGEAPPPPVASPLAAPLAAAAMTVAWAVPAYFTVVLKHAADPAPAGYLLWTGALMGLAMGWWARAAARQRGR